MMLILTIFAVATVSGAFGMGFVLGFYASPEQKESNKLRSVIEGLTTELRNVTASLSAAWEENASLNKRIAALTRHYLDQTDRVRVAEQRRNDADLGDRVVRFVRSEHAATSRSISERN